MAVLYCWLAFGLWLLFLSSPMITCFLFFNSFKLSLALILQVIGVESCLSIYLRQSQLWDWRDTETERDRDRERDREREAFYLLICPFQGLFLKCQKEKKKTHHFKHMEQ